MRADEVVVVGPGSQGEIALIGVRPVSGVGRVAHAFYARRTARVPYPFAFGAKGWVWTPFSDAVGCRTFISSTWQSLILTGPGSPKA